MLLPAQIDLKHMVARHSGKYSSALRLHLWEPQVESATRAGADRDARLREAEARQVHLQEELRRAEARHAQLQAELDGALRERCALLLPHATVVVTAW